MTLYEEIRELCRTLSQNRRLVQGAGGNVSWKDQDTLFVKASGKWLGDALTENIFVSVPLPEARAMIRRRSSNLESLSSPPELRPSIETALHVLMPQTVVLHIHPIDLLSVVTSVNYSADLNALNILDETTLCLDYVKPGEDLADRLAEEFCDKTYEVIFLQNHGIVIGGGSVEAVLNTLDGLLKKTGATLNDKSCTTPVNSIDYSTESYFSGAGLEYFKLVQADISRLCLNTDFWPNISKYWRYAPDHVVFLGAQPVMLEDLSDIKSCDPCDKLLMIRGEGVFVNKPWSLGKHQQLVAFADLLATPSLTLSPRNLDDNEVRNLLGWDKEQYRLAVQK